jgi:deoxyhypusine synthase
MTIAKMGLVICDMIDHGMVQTVCSTGALMAHGLVESIGLGHFKYDPNLDDAELAALELNRVTDTLEPETNLNDVARKMALVLEHYIDDRQPLSPRLLHQQVGRYLTETYPQQRGILKSAYEQQVPVIVPAFHDSELGNDVCLYNTLRQRQGQDPLVFNQELDTRFLLNMATQSEKLGIFTIGGGVPRNYMQNLPPLVDILKGNQLVDWPDIRFAYGCRICPDPTYLGHLSGCTYSEGMSWRKMDINGQFSEIRADATQVWPFLIKYVLEAQE